MSEAPQNPPPETPAAPPAEPTAAQPQTTVAADDSEADEQDDALPLSSQAAVQMLEQELAAARPSPQPRPQSPSQEPPAAGPGPANQQLAQQLAQQLGQQLGQAPAPPPARSNIAGFLLLALVLLFISERHRSQAPAPRPKGQAELTKKAPQPAAETALKQAKQQRLVPFGPNRALFYDGQRFLVLEADKQQQLQVQRVFELIYDPYRFHGDPRRSFHGYYFDDTVKHKRRVLNTLHGDFQAALAEDPLNRDRALNLARRIAAFHDLDFLAEYLKDERFVVRRACALALGEMGYVIGLKELIFSMNTGDESFREHLNEVLEKLTGRRFMDDPSDPEQDSAMREAENYYRHHEPKSKYELGFTAQKRLLGH